EVIAESHGHAQEVEAALRRALESRNLHARWKAARVFEQLGTSQANYPTVRDGLDYCLKSDDPGLRVAAMYWVGRIGLGELPQPDVCKALLQGLEDSSFKMFTAAADALGRLTDQGIRFILDRQSNLIATTVDELGSGRSFHSHDKVVPLDIDYAFV